MILRRCSVRGSVLLPDPDLVGLMLLTGPQRHQNMCRDVVGQVEKILTSVKFNWYDS